MKQFNTDYYHGGKCNFKLGFSRVRGETMVIITMIGRDMERPVTKWFTLWSYTAMHRFIRSYSNIDFANKMLVKIKERIAL